MIVEPKIRGFICTTAHPDGCRAHVQEQIDYVKCQGSFEGPKKVLIVGASTGYGLASRIASAFGSGAATIGVFFDKAAKGKRTATAGWYNTVAFEAAAAKEGLYAKSFNGDAFSHEMKQTVIETIKKDLGKVDMVIYSLASPRRTDPDTGETYKSVLKPMDQDYSNTTIDIMSGELSEVSIEKATEAEAIETIKVMGGEDWALWMHALKEAGVLAEGCMTTAYSYIGPKLTVDIYRSGTIGKAKEDLEQTAFAISKEMAALGGKAFVTVCKALVTQASAAIPVVPLYMTLLFKIMKAQGTHEGCIEQMYRLMTERLNQQAVPVDNEGRIRIDDLEMADDVQDTIESLWQNIHHQELADIADLEGFRTDFLKLFGFAFEGVDYTADVEVELMIPSVTSTDV